MTILIKSGTLVTAAETFIADVLIEGEKIAAIGSNLNVPMNAKVVDAAGKLVMPGGVDAHVHLDLPMFDTVSSDDHYTGTKAAAFGGTTTVIDFISQDVEPLMKNVDTWRAKAEGRAAVDYSFHMNLTCFNEKVAGEIPQLVKAGITSLKVFTAYNNRLRLQDGDIFQVLRIAKEYGLLVMAHCENGDVIDILVREALQKSHTCAGMACLNPACPGRSGIHSAHDLPGLAGECAGLHRPYDHSWWSEAVTACSMQESAGHG